MNLHPDALAYVARERVCVFAIEMLDGSPHASTVHFAHAGEAPTFIFLTEKKYRKAEPLFGKPQSRASMVLGFLEGKMQTLQMDGVAEVLKEVDIELRDAYFAKFSEKKLKLDESNNFFFKFTPSWWRFTDWTRPEGKTIYLSDGSVNVVSKIQQLKVS